MCRQSERTFLNSNVFSRCLHNMANFGPVPTNGWDRFTSSGHLPAHFNGFHVLASLLHWRWSPEANQTLYNVWPSSGLVHYIYIFGGSCLLTELCQVQNSLCVQVLRLPILAALMHATHSSSGRQPNFATWYIQGMELRNFRFWSFSTEDATYIPRAAISWA